MRMWHDGHYDCDVEPGSPRCLCCFKLFGEESYCQFIPVDKEQMREDARETIDEEECAKCRGSHEPEWCCGYTYPENKLKWSGQTRLTEVRE